MYKRQVLEQSFDFVSLYDVKNGKKTDTNKRAYFCDVSVTTAPVTKTLSKAIAVQESAVEYVTIPPTFETIMETIVVQEAAAEGSTFKNISETYVMQPSYVEKISIPGVFETTTRSANLGTVNGKMQTKSYSTRILKTPPRIQERVVPAVTKQVTKRVVDKHGIGSRIIPCLLYTSPSPRD